MFSSAIALLRVLIFILTLIAMFDSFGFDFEIKKAPGDYM
jgi:hypothetical protein